MPTGAFRTAKKAACRACRKSERAGLRRFHRRHFARYVRQNADGRAGAFAQVSGVGERKAHRYGKAFLEEINRKAEEE